MGQQGSWVPAGTGLPQSCCAAAGDVVQVLADVAPWTPLYAVLPQPLGGLTVSDGCPGIPTSRSSLGDGRTLSVEAWTGVPTLLPLPVSPQFRLRNHDTPLVLTRRGLVLAPAGGFEPSKDTQVGSSVPRLSEPPLSPPGLSPSLALPAALPIRHPSAPGPGNAPALSLFLSPSPAPSPLHLDSCPSPRPWPYFHPHSGLQFILIPISTPIPIPVPAPSPIHPCPHPHSCPCDYPHPHPYPCLQPHPCPHNCPWCHLGLSHGCPGAAPQMFRLEIEVMDRRGHNCSGAVRVEVLPSRRPRVTFL